MNRILRRFLQNIMYVNFISKEKKWLKPLYFLSFPLPCYRLAVFKTWNFTYKHLFGEDLIWSVTTEVRQNKKRLKLAYNVRYGNISYYIFDRYKCIVRLYFNVKKNQTYFQLYSCLPNDYVIFIIHSLNCRYVSVIKKKPNKEQNRKHSAIRIKGARPPKKGAT